eukprot:CAMPEP_0115046168 /NCGR_PEP_ID=MMETSP0216-20121206/48595_1 /TAXON_ID=223996 /ORGANISM="Protocruzia adherens, Strain Boccale" /LENGTH=236 /DNA_ID=CAMNT_0002429211 /DNA_START=25 /DNA_END=735 /DNA_ORIENTATION=-
MSHQYPDMDSFFTFNNTPFANSPTWTSHFEPEWRGPFGEDFSFSPREEAKEGEESLKPFDFTTPIGETEEVNDFFYIQEADQEDVFGSYLSTQHNLHLFNNFDEKESTFKTTTSSQDLPKSSHHAKIKKSKAEANGQGNASTKRAKTAAEASADLFETNLSAGDLTSDDTNSTSTQSNASDAEALVDTLCERVVRPRGSNVRKLENNYYVCTFKGCTKKFKHSQSVYKHRKTHFKI